MAKGGGRVCVPRADAASRDGCRDGWSGFRHWCHGDSDDGGNHNTDDDNDAYGLGGHAYEVTGRCLDWVSFSLD